MMLLLLLLLLLRVRPTEAHTSLPSAVLMWCGVTGAAALQSIRVPSQRQVQLMFLRMPMQSLLHRLLMLLCLHLSPPHYYQRAQTATTLSMMLAAVMLLLVSAMVKVSPPVPLVLLLLLPLPSLH